MTEEEINLGSWRLMVFSNFGPSCTKAGFKIARFFGKCKQGFVRDFELDNFEDELDKILG